MCLLPSARAVAAFGKPKRFDTRFELAIGIEIAAQEGRRAKRPYVAAWLENQDGKPVRTLSLWVQNTGRGPRWIPDLRRWFRGEQSRQSSDGGNLIESISSATRLPGKYELVWDGKDDKGKLVDQGEYTLFIEAVREHGTYQLISQKLSIADKPFSTTYAGNVELSGGSIEFRKRK